MTILHKTFEAVLEQSAAKGGWTYVIWPESASFFGTKGLVKVRADVDGIPFESAFMALGDGRHKLPVNAGLRKRLHKESGDRVVITLHERI
ncbi:MAG: DUF1905 domain-containing protein [Mucilaginibacter polytrichastri]|nr:DUF1905 domain-containing protein [Mucilaginibacter polytrichastri]